MQSAAFTLSPSPSLTFRESVTRGSFGFKFDRVRLSAAASNNRDLASSDAVSGLSASYLPRRSWALTSPSSPPWLRPWSGVQNFGYGNESDRLEARAAASVSDAASEEKGSGSLSKTLELAVLFGLWFVFNIYFNIYNKQVLKVFHYPANVTLLQVATGSVLILFMWTFNLYKRPKVTRSQLLTILPLAIVHTLGNLFTNMSLGKVSVSFTHTIKAMEPFFSVVLSAMFLGEMPTPWIVASLVPVVGGVALASATEASFNWVGFWSAMASNLTNQSRNVLSKKLMVKKEDSMDNINLFSIITVMSFFLTIPATFFMEGFKFAPSHLHALAQTGVNINQLLTRSLLAALCFHAYQQVSYMILQRVSPVTHSVGNCVKRVVVIISSVLVFHTPVSAVNSIGTGIALAGVFLYSRVKRIKPKQKAT